MENQDISNFRIGVLSDTHGRLDRRVFDRFEGVQAILHAGDVGTTEILIDLGALAPTFAVIGNTDQGGDCWRLPLRTSKFLGGLKVHVTHGHLQADPNSRIEKILHAVRDDPPDLAIVGHSHRPYVGVHRGVIFLNPGSASQPRYGFPASVALIEAKVGRPEIQIVDLDGIPIQPGPSI